MKKIYAFEFDGTIVTNAYPDIGAPIQSTINLLKNVRLMVIILFYIL